MNQESTIGFESDNYILAPALERGDLLALELDRDFPGVVGSGQTRIADRDLLEAAVLDQRCKLRPDRLDFGKLGHG